MVNAFKVYSHHRTLQPGQSKPEELTLMEFSMRVAKTLCDEGVESRKRSPIKRRRAEEEAPTAATAARPAPVCSFVDFSVAQGEPEFIERGGKQVLNTTPPRFRRRCTSGCGKKTRMCCATHSTPEALVPVCNDAGCLLRHASDHSSIIETKWGQFRAVRV